MANTGPYMSVQSLLAVGKEATRGQIAGVQLSIPIDPNPVLKPNQAWGQDDGLRGSPVDRYNSVPLTRSDDYTPKGKVFLDTFPWLMLALLGGPDTVAGTAAPYTHSIKLLNTAGLGSQPPSYSLYDYDIVQQGASDNCKVIGAGQLDTLTLTFAATGALEWSAKFTGNPFVETGKPAGISYSSEVFVPAYNGALYLSGARTYLIESGKLTMKRGTAPIFTIGQQGPYRNWAGPLVVTGTLKILALKTDQTMNKGLTYYKTRVSLTWTDPVSAHSMTFSLTQVQFSEPQVTRGGIWESVTVKFFGTANATNASSGYAQLAFAAANGRQTAY